MNIRRIMKLHDGMLKEICAKYQLTPIEAKIIRFLYNRKRFRFSFPQERKTYGWNFRSRMT